MTKNSKKGKIVSCLDMGSSKLICIIASVSNEEIEILGYGHKESRGINASAISDMRIAQKSIINVIAEAERMAGFNIEKLMIGISGSQVISSRKEFGCKISSEAVKDIDIFNLTSKVRSDFKKNNREIIHMIPMYYRIDDSTAVMNPRFMSGNNLFAKFHVISTSQTTIRNIENCIKRCQVSVNNYMVEPYASALACLSQNEMDLGTLLIDIGGSSTSFCVIIEDKVVFVGSSPIGGDLITKDIATILGVNISLAEKIKNLNGSLFISPIEEREIIKYRLQDSVSDSMIRITRIELRDIIQSRLEELFESVKLTLDKSKIPYNLVPNIVITGGVASILGIDKLASEIFSKNTKIGYPTKFNNAPSEIINPTNSCALGMLVYLRKQYLKDKNKENSDSKGNWFKRFLDKVVAV
ncbi:MAG: cell division protein FtsA [Alphaproteobacteria bacterium]